MNQPPNLLTKAAAARHLGCCARSVENFIARGELPVVKLGKLCRIDPRDLDRFIAACKKGGNDAQ